MTRRRLLFSGCAVGAVLLAGSAAVTQFGAWRLGYDQALGQPLIGHVYAPWSWLSWQFEQWPAAEGTLRMMRQGGYWTGGAAFLAGLKVGMGRGPDTPLHGETKWATERDIRRVGLRDQHGGIVVGRTGGPGDGLLVLGGQESVALMAPPRSGKGVGVVIPNALGFEGSGLILDLKREVWDATAGYRAETGHQVALFDPLSPTGETQQYNPLAYVRRGTVDCYGDVERLAFMLIPDVPGPNGFFPKAARGGFVGVTTMVAESDDIRFCMGEIVRILVRSDVKEFLKKRLDEARDGGRPYSRACADACRSFINARSDTFEDIRKTITSDLGLFLNPRVAAATEENDFDFRLMRQQRMWVYFALTPGNVDRLRPLVNLFFQQFVDAMAEVRPEQDPLSRHKVLLLLDEFPQLGRMPVLAGAAAFMAGYNVRVLYVMQAKRQLREIYGDAGGEALIATCGLEVVYGTKDQQLAEELSRRIGTSTAKSRSLSRPSSWLGGGGRQSETLSETARPLLLPQEITRLEAHEVLLFRSGAPPIKAERISHFRESPFRDVLREPPQVPILEVPLDLDEGHGATAANPQAGGRGVSSIGAELISLEMAEAFKTVFDATSEAEEVDEISAWIERDGAVQVGQS